MSASFIFFSSQHVSNGPSFACMRVERKNILKENITPIFLHRYGSAIIQTSVKFSYFSIRARANLLRAEGGWTAHISQTDCFAARYRIQLTAQNRREANHRQTYPIQSWLWKENLINIITNEMERGKKKDHFHLVVVEDGWSVLRQCRRKELSL